MRSTIIIGTILLFGGTGTALAETTSVAHQISQATFVANCEEMDGNAIEGSMHASCELPSGTEVTCSFEPPESNVPNGVCEVENRLASARLEDLLGDAPLGVNWDPPAQSLTSSDSVSSGADAGPVTGGSKGGKGSHVGGADGLVGK